MEKQRFTPAYPAEVGERGVRLFRENRAKYAVSVRSDCSAAG
jgi:transposase